MTQLLGGDEARPLAILRITVFGEAADETLLGNYQRSIFSDMDPVDRLGLERQRHRFA